MPEYSLNEQFEDLFQKTLKKQQHNNKQEMEQHHSNNESAKITYFFQGYKAIKKKESLI